MAGMTTDELIKQVLEHDAKATPGPWDAEGQGGIRMNGIRDSYRIDSGDERAICWGFRQGSSSSGYANAQMTAAYRTAAPLLARKLQRALEVLECIYDGTYDAADSNVFLDEIEAME